MRIVEWIALAVLAAAAVCVLTLLALPWLLQGHAFQLRQVKARFETPAEQFELAAQAVQKQQAVFSALYDPLENRLIDAYVPPRASFAYFLLRGVNHGGEIAAKEDFLPAPPAPMAFEFIAVESPVPFRVADCKACTKYWLIVFGGLGAAALGSLLALRRGAGAGVLSAARRS